MGKKVFFWRLTFLISVKTAVMKEARMERMRKARGPVRDAATPPDSGENTALSSGG